MIFEGPPVNGQHRYFSLTRERRKATVWIVATWLSFIAMFAVSMYVLTMAQSSGSKWEGAVVLGTCGGLPMLQRTDGTVWLRVNSVRVYRIEDPNKLTCG